MKLQFKEQGFQIDAVQSVLNCFAGQKIKSEQFKLERSQDLLRKAQNAVKGLSDLYEKEVDESIGYRNSPIEITEEQIFQNICKTQREQDLLESTKIERPQGIKIGYNLTIEMETGTGKTYTYIRTMYELHKQYGWSKFIVIVPSIAIREGVFKSFEVTQEHFQGIFGHKIAPFIYNSSRPQDIENFASDSRISVMIINTQAFSSKKENDRSEAVRRIYKELDQFASRAPIEIISQTNPIIIIDEPQSVDGEQTLQSMQDFKPLFTLRYSATHKVEYNKIYRLDALDAYNKLLVKKIAAKGIVFKGGLGLSDYLYLEQIIVSTDKPPLAFIEFEKRTPSGIRRAWGKFKKGDSLFELSGENPNYKHYNIENIDGYLNSIEVNGQVLNVGEAFGNDNEKDFRRIQIRETIKSHLKKEEELYAKNIKVLSLFFIDSVEKYRVYNEQGEETLGEYAKIFEEEYRMACWNIANLFNQNYVEYIEETSPEKVHKGYLPKEDANDFEKYITRVEANKLHQGYFSIDKKNKLIDPSTKRPKKGEDAISDDISAYDLIMKDKERLLSFEEPTRFIFSHSALKEGWDNPNVFQICTLKQVEAGSEIRRRQEVGRGMRLCVNANGIRQDFDTVGDQVHDINKLTIIASESYEDFAEGLQKEIANSLKDRPQKASEEFFIGKMITEEGGEARRIDKEFAKKIHNFLIRKNILDDDDKITAEGKIIIENNELIFPENLVKHQHGITRLLKSIYTGGMPLPENDRKKIPLKTNVNFAKKEFQELWSKINLKTVYTVDIVTEILIQNSVEAINNNLHITERTYEVKEGELSKKLDENNIEKDLSKEDLTNKEGFSHPTRTPVLLKINNIYTNARYDIVGEIEKKTNLTRKTIVEILKKIEAQKFKLIHKNPEEFIANCNRLINEVKAKLIINKIAYHKTEERYDSNTVFTNSKEVIMQSETFKKHIYDYLTTDSGVERAFAQELEGSTEVTVYAKLPKSFFITTPIANYSPDWAIVFDKEKIRHIYFVAETKGSDSENELREIEKLKIECAKHHFKEISNGEVQFETISSYEGLSRMLQRGN